MPNEWWKNPELAFIYGNQNSPLETEYNTPNNTIGQKYGFTGNGIDGISQPNKIVPGKGRGDYDVHETEFIFDANSTQAIGPELLKETMNAAKSGNLDLNKIREAVGQPPKQGYKCGGIVKPSYQQGGIVPASPVSKNSYQQISEINKPVSAIGSQIKSKPTAKPIAKPITNNVINKNVIRNQPDIRAPKPVTPENPEDPENVTIPNIDLKPIPDVEIEKIPEIKPDVDPNDPTQFLIDIMGGDSDYIDLIKQRASQDVGGAGAAATAALKQEATQRGMSPEQIASMDISRQRDVEQNVSGVVGDIAETEARMGVEAAKDVFAQQFAKDQFDYQQNMDQFNQQLIQGDYTNAAKTFNKIHGTDIDFSKAIEKENLSNFNNAFNNLNQSIASGMSFDDWLNIAQADGTFDKLNMTESDIKSMYENMRLQQNPIFNASQKYQDLVNQGLLSQDQMDDIMSIMSWSLSHPEGLTVSDSFQVLDENGKEIGNFKTKEEADSFVSENPGSTVNLLNNGWIETGNITGTGTVSEVANEINSAQNYLDQLGVDSQSSERIQQYLDEHGGKIDGITAKDWNAWDSKTGDPARIRDYFNGNGLEDLTSADKKMLSQVADAQERVDAGKGTEKDKELLAKIGNISVAGWDMSTNANSDYFKHHYKAKGVGKLHSETKVNNDVYGISGSTSDRNGNTTVSFNEKMKNWAQQNAGRMIEIDGKYYRISDDPIKSGFDIGKISGKSGNDAYSFGWKVDALKVIDPETGKEKYVTYGVYGSHWDQSRDKGKNVIDEQGIKVWDV